MKIYLVKQSILKSDKKKLSEIRNFLKYNDFGKKVIMKKVPDANIISEYETYVFFGNNLENVKLFNFKFFCDKFYNFKEMIVYVTDRNIVNKTAYNHMKLSELKSMIGIETISEIWIKNETNGKYELNETDYYMNETKGYVVFKGFDLV